MTQNKKSASKNIKIDNEKTRVTEWYFSIGSSTGWHLHEYDYIVVPMTDGNLTILDKNSNQTVSKLKKGEPYFRKAGVEHEVINENAFDFYFIEIELK